MRRSLIVSSADLRSGFALVKTFYYQVVAASFLVSYPCKVKKMR